MSISKVPRDLCLQPGNVIQFTIMDHDLMWTNDFEGEAYLELCQVPGVRDDLNENEHKSLPTIELYLTNPKSIIILL